jgi:molybdopterin-guanine dinucleotide biosynthesis protein A
MGVDKATLEFMGRPMVEIAVEKLRGFCADVSIVGNRDDLSGFAEVVREERVDVGPGAGIEAGLRAARQEWVMFVPVDVPLVPEELLRRWAEDGLRRSTSKYFGGSYLTADDVDQPAFCLLPRGSRMLVTKQLDAGERRLLKILDGITPAGTIRSVTPVRAEELCGLVPATKLQIETWFANVNTRNELEVAEEWARQLGKV